MLRGNEGARWWSRWWLVAVAALAIPILLYAYDDGPPSEHTGGFGEPTCTECHVGCPDPACTGPGSVTISGLPAAYQSGGVYTLTVRVADPQRNRWGFELSARTQSGQQAGTLSPINNQTQLVPTFNGIQYIAHTTAGTRAGTANGVNFQFRWTAPAITAGPVIFNAAGNAANNSGSEFGDRIYITSATVQPQAAGPPPAVFTGGVVNNASFAPSPAPVAPGSIAAIFGSNLNDGSTVLSSSFGDDGRLVSSLGNASVTVNGFPAPMFYSTPGQLGIQIPLELAGQSSAQVVVTVLGQSSAPQTIFLDSAAPGIFTFNQAGTGDGAITHADVNGTPVTPQNPAHRNEIVVLYATGLGEVTPPLVTGFPSAANTTTTAATVTLDGVPVPVIYSGMAPGFVGLNQINFRIPADARTGDGIPVVVSIGTKRSNTATISIAP